MKHYWLNDSEPDQDGNYIAEVRDDDTPTGEPGRRVATYKGTTVKEVADKLLQAAANSATEFARIRAERKPDQAPARATVAEPQPLTPDDSFRIAADLENPERATAAVQEIVTRTTGATPELIHQTVKEAQDARQSAYLLAEANAFIAAHPDYYATQHNYDALTQMLKIREYGFTRNNLGIVYDELTSKGLLTQRPAGNEQQPGTPGSNRPAESNPPQTRPRQASTTGLRNSDSSADRPPAQPTEKLTRRQVEEMPAAEYRERYRDPKFRQAVDAMAR